MRSFMARLNPVRLSSREWKEKESEKEWRWWEAATCIALYIKAICKFRGICSNNAISSLNQRVLKLEHWLVQLINERAKAEIHYRIKTCQNKPDLGQTQLCYSLSLSLFKKGEIVLFELDIFLLRSLRGDYLVQNQAPFLFEQTLKNFDQIIPSNIYQMVHCRI